MDMTYAHTENPQTHPNTTMQIAVKREYTLKKISGISKTTSRTKSEKCVKIVYAAGSGV